MPLLMSDLLIPIWVALLQKSVSGAIPILEKTVQIISSAAPLVIALVTLWIAWMTFKVSKESKKVAVESKEVAVQSHATSQESLQVAINDWKQVGREAPWNLTKLHDNFWLLERVHHDPAVIVTTDVSPHCSGSGMGFMNPSGMPLAVFRRTDKIVMNIPATNPGTDLVLYYREFTEDEPVPTRNEHFFGDFAWSDEGIAAREGTKSWSTPLY